MTKRTRRIVIVGGGTAGWLSAAVIAAEHGVDVASEAGQPRFSVTLVESPDVPTIGVGEGTWPSMRSTLQKIGISESDFIAQCNVSLKQGTLFRNWYRHGENYVHPFTVPHGYNLMNLAPYWQVHHADRRFADVVSPQASVVEQYLAPKQSSTPDYAFVLNYGYHLDAGRFADLLKSHCVTNLGVQHTRANVTSVEADNGGDIVSILTDSEGRIEGDLFIDCSGSRSLLLAEHYGVPFVSASDVLFNDSALAMQVPYREPESPINSCTLSTAQVAGWIWDIGLSSRRGAGYVYSSAHQSEDQAATLLYRYLEAEPELAAAADLQYRKLSFKPGHRAEFWHRNCVAVGMASGFIEPLEASALALVELSAKMIAEQLPHDRAAMEISARRFNKKMLKRWDRIIEFLKLHYVLSDRQEDYWQDNRAVSSLPESLAEALDFWRHQSPWHDNFEPDDLFPSASYQYILYGMHFETMPRVTRPRNHAELDVRAEQLIRENAERVKTVESALPTNRELLGKAVNFDFRDSQVPQPIRNTR